MTSAHAYFWYIIILNLIILLPIIIITSTSFSETIIILIFTLLGDIVILNLIGKKRNNEISYIKSIITNIRKNTITSTDEIKMGRSLLELEGEIKAMFFRVQKDISNLKKLEQVRKEFLGNVSHELRTPIFAIQGYLETLKEGAINDEQVKDNFLDKAIRHTNNLNDLLNDLIDISMIESGNMKMSFRYFKIGGFLEQIIKDFHPLAEKKNLEIILHPVKDSLEVFGDKKKLKQVFNNLILNAIKYTEEGSVEIFIIPEKKNCKIVVKDSGIGLSEEDKSRIFERFYRVDKGRSRAVGGTGLGLAIVKHIIEAHNSSVKVESELGKGSEFSFELQK